MSVPARVVNDDRESGRRGEEHYRVLLDSAPDAMVLVDHGGVIRLVNAQLERLLGYRAAELVGRPVEILLPEAQRDVHRHLRARFQAAPRARPMGAGLELSARRRDGSEVAVDISLGPVAGDGPPLVLAALRDVSERRDLERIRAIEARESEARRLLESRIRAQEAERSRIAADIHDDTVQALSAAVLRLQQVRRRLSDPAGGDLLDQLEQSIRRSILGLRRLMFDLHPAALDHSGLVGALRDVLGQGEEEHGLRWELDDRLRTEPPAEVRLSLYRVAREALANVRKHAGAGLVRVAVSSEGAGCRVTVSDDGRGFDAGAAEPAGHLGLFSMRQRAELGGGTLAITSAPGRGTIVDCWLPFAPPAD